MAMQQNFLEPGASHFESNTDVSLHQKWSSISSTLGVPENNSGCFDCNICLDSAHDPVVTLCGHLYCWPCIYKWLHVQTSSPDTDHRQHNCPVCKASISLTSLVPLYGHGSSTSQAKPKKPQLGLIIPSRPTASALNGLISSTTTSTSHPGFFHHQRYFPHSNGGNEVGATIGLNPTVGVFGEMVYARIFGSSDANFAYSYLHPYLGTGISSPRMRRPEMQLDKSLTRVSVFLFCCIMICLLLF